MDNLISHEQNTGISSLQAMNTEIEHLNVPELVDAINNVANSHEAPFLNPRKLTLIRSFINHAVINRSTEELKTIHELFFRPQIPTTEDIESYRTMHLQIYERAAIELASKLAGNVDFILLESGMYGGKSTLAHLTLQLLENEYPGSTEYLVAGIIDEDEITARGLHGIGGGLKIPANRIGKSNYKEVIDQITTQNKRFVVLEEYSFFEGSFVEELLSEFQSKGIKVILAGLDTDFMGRSLEGFRAAETFISSEEQKYERYQCRSFVKGISDQLPSGTMTSRYLVLSNGQMILDVFAPVIVPKGTDWVRYLPQIGGIHIRNLVKIMSGTNIQTEEENNNVFYGPDPYSDQLFLFKSKLH